MGSTEAAGEGGEMKPRHILQSLYDSEINASISWFWDGGFDWRLGDELNGYVAEGTADSFSGACEELRLSAIRHFPHSTFAKEATKRVVWVRGELLKVWPTGEVDVRLVNPEGWEPIEATFRAKDIIEP